MNVSQCCNSVNHTYMPWLPVYSGCLSNLQNGAFKFVRLHVNIAKNVSVLIWSQRKEKERTAKLEKGT